MLKWIAGIFATVVAALLIFWIERVFPDTPPYSVDGTHKQAAAGAAISDQLAGDLPS